MTIYDFMPAISMAIQASILAALLASALLRIRNKVYKRIHEEETCDDDNDGIPDVYQSDPISRDN